jgi:membrane-associated phospholipid phosphatase
MKKSMSFPSSHAANMGAMASYFSVKYPKTRWIVIPIALIIAYSRIYVGVHYPTDVLAGLLLGIGCGWFILRAESWIGRSWSARRLHRSGTSGSGRTSASESGQETIDETQTQSDMD